MSNYQIDIHFISLLSPICLLSLGSLNCQPHILPSCQLHVTNATLPSCQVYWTTQNALKYYKFPNIAWNVFFGGGEILPQKVRTQFSHISKGLKSLFVSINFVLFCFIHESSSKLHNKIICFMLVISCFSYIALKAPWLSNAIAYLMPLQFRGEGKLHVKKRKM